MPLDKSELENRVFEGFAETSRRRYAYLCNMETDVSRWSRNAVEDFGLPAEYFEHAGELWSEHIHPEDRTAYQNDIQLIFSGQKERHCMDYRVLNKDGDYVLCTCMGRVVKGKDGEPDLFVGTIENHGIMDNVDAVTNLYNIYEFYKQMDQVRINQSEISVLLVGINHFTDINDSYGYVFGNKVLRKFADLIQTEISEKKYLYRMDGAKFAICLANGTEEKISELYKKLQNCAKHNIYIGDIRTSLSLSGGAVLYNKNFDRQSIQTSASYALSKSKHEHHGELVIFDYKILEDNKKNAQSMNAIRNSIPNGFEGFYMCYQPIMGAEKETLIGAEALLRWKKEPFGEIPPGLFLPWLENDPRFWDLGKWILETSLTEMKEILDCYPDFMLNVNLAYPQIAHAEFLKMIKETLDKTGYPAKNLCLELTERCRQLEMKYLQSVVEELKIMGIKIAIDDFGTGFSSLNLLSELPVDTIKIDRGFIWDIQTNLSNQAIVKAVTGCADDLNVHVCLEGLENQGMINFVKQYMVYSYQGYHFSRPIPRESFISKYKI